MALGSEVALSSGATEQHILAVRAPGVVDVEESVPLTPTQRETLEPAELADRQHDGPSPLRPADEQHEQDTAGSSIKKADVVMEAAEAELGSGTYIPVIGDEGAPTPAVGEHTLSANAIQAEGGRVGQSVRGNFSGMTWWWRAPTVSRTNLSPSWVQP